MATIATAFTFRQPEPRHHSPTIGALQASLPNGSIPAPVTPEQLFLPALTQAIDGSSRQGSNGKTFLASATRSIAAPVQPVSAKRRRSSKLLAPLMILALCLLALAGSTIMAYALLTNQHAAPVSSSSPSLGERAQALVQQYYADLNNRNYQAAYTLWQQKSTSTYCDFLQGFAFTEQDSIVTQVGQVKGDKIDVPITLVATEALPGGRVLSTYQGNEELQQMNGSLELTGGKISRISRIPSATGLLPVLAPGASTTQQAQSVIMQFYNYINQRDYPAAYSLWGQDYRSQNQYCRFVGGYLHTRHVEVQVNALTPFGDGTVQSDTTLTAQDDSMAIHTYSASYIVGQESSAWKILRGTQNLIQ